MGPDEGDDWLHLLLLSQMIDKAVYAELLPISPHISPYLPISFKAVYAELRTKQQLGYIVQCGSTEADGVRGLVFIVQSSVQPAVETTSARMSQASVAKTWTSPKRRGEGKPAGQPAVIF